jgi:hypothetical protein
MPEFLSIDFYFDCIIMLIFVLLPPGDLAVGFLLLLLGVIAYSTLYPRPG